jgi:hypothetical protein
MAFTTAELALVNQGLGRIGATVIATTDNGNVKCNEYVQSLLHYGQSRDSLLRSNEWPFAIGQSELVQIKTLVLDHQPLPDAWVVGDVITGITSGETAEILTVTSATQYEIIYQSGDYESNETLTNATVYDVLYEGIPVTWEDANVVWYESATADETTCVITVASITPSFRYDYQYELPDDYQRLTKNWEETESDYEWAVQGHRLLSGEDAVTIEYVRKVTDPAEFDSLFYEVLVLTLALKLLAPLAGGQTTTFRQDLKQELYQLQKKAGLVCTAETKKSGRSDWFLARFS